MIEVQDNRQIEPKKHPVPKRIVIATALASLFVGSATGGVMIAHEHITTTQVCTAIDPFIKADQAKKLAIQDLKDNLRTEYDHPDVTFKNTPDEALRKASMQFPSAS